MRHAGIGLRMPHAEALMAQRPALAFVEVHSENFFADGGAALAMLDGVRAAYDVSLHGVGLGLGSAAGLDDWHLERLARLVERVDPVRVSDHACFARVARGGTVVHAADLLPLAFTEAALDILVANVQRVQERLKRPILVENIAAYVAFDGGLPEGEFLAALCRRSGCALLLDLNNLVVNAVNAGAADPAAAAGAVVAALAPGSVGEIHLAGWRDVDGVAIDDHGSRVREPVWRALQQARECFGAVPTLVEWDTELPPLDVLLDEADRAEALLA